MAKTKLLSTRITEELMAAIKAKAASLNRETSDWVRLVLMRAVK